MRILNFGSINIDYVYKVPHFVRPGETISSQSLTKVLGGKGANQSIALARSGADVLHLGMINRSDEWATDILRQAKVDTRFVEPTVTASGHAIIQVNPEGENCIVLHGGANQEFTESEIRTAIDYMKADDWLLLQNECNAIDIAVDLANQKQMKIAFNPAPVTDAVKRITLEKLDVLIVNEIELQDLTASLEVEEGLKALSEQFPLIRIVLTRGSQGATLCHGSLRIDVQAPVVEVVDTTGAGDTFVGFYLAALMEGKDDNIALNRACQAAAIAVTRPGASTSIPAKDEILSREEQVSTEEKQ